jgi:hypothetical protein
VRPLDGLHVEVENAIVAADCGVSRVGEGTGLTITEPSYLRRLVRRKRDMRGGGGTDIVLVSAEVLTFRSSTVISVYRGSKYLRVEEEAYFSLKAQNCWLITCQTISSEDIFGD